MSADEFWKDDPQLFVSYRTSFINKKQREMGDYDYICWLQGLYIHDGNGKLFLSLKQFLGNLVASMFKGKKDNSKIDTYPVKPYNELAKEREKDKIMARKQNNYDDFQKSLVYFGTVKKRYEESVRNKAKKGE